MDRNCSVNLSYARMFPMRQEQLSLMAQPTLRGLQPILLDRSKLWRNATCNDSEVDMDRAQQTEMANSFLARHRAAPVAAECVGCIERTTLRRCRVRCAGDNQRGRCLGVGISRWRIRSLGGGGGCDRAYRAVRASTGTADIEAGYGATPAEVGAHVAEIIQAGVIGINLEDGLHGPIRSIEDAAARLRAAREAASKEGVPIVLNARCDVFQLQHGCLLYTSDAADDLTRVD